MYLILISLQNNFKHALFFVHEREDKTTKDKNEYTFLSHIVITAKKEKDKFNLWKL